MDGPIRASLAIPLRRPEIQPVLRWTARFLGAGAGLTLAFNALQASGLSQRPDRDALLGALLGLLIVHLLVRRPRGLSREVSLSFDADSVQLPFGYGFYRTLHVPLTEIEAVERGRSGLGSRLFVVLRRSAKRPRCLTYSERLFRDPEDLERFRFALSEALLTAPISEQQRSETAELQAQWNAVRRRPTMITRIFLVLILALGLPGLSLEALFIPDLERLIRLGAAAPVLVAQGEWWRVLTANFLHVNVIHLGFNAVALWTFGSNLERLLGSPRFFLVLLISGVVGVTFSLAHPSSPILVGASTAVFGVFGGLLILNWRFSDLLPPDALQPRAWWLALLVGEAYLALAVPQVSSLAHLGGFIGGASLSFLALRGVKTLALEDAPRRRAVRWAIGLMLVPTTLGLLLAARTALDPQADHFSKLLQSIPSTFDAQGLNLFAWSAVTREPRASRAALEEARRLARAAVAAEPRTADCADTLAVLEHLLGDDRAAAAHERVALAHARAQDRRVFATRLAQFLARSAPPRVDGPVSTSSVNLSLGGVGLELRRPPGAPLVLFAEVGRAGGPLGLLQVGVTADQPAVVQLSLPPTLGRIEGDEIVEWLWLDARTPLDEELGARFDPHFPEALEQLVAASVK